MQTLQTKHLNVSNEHSNNKKANTAEALNQKNIQLFSPLNSSERSSKSSHLNIS